MARVGKSLVYRSGHIVVIFLWSAVDRCGAVWGKCEGVPGTLAGSLAPLTQLGLHRQQNLTTGFAT